MPITENKRTVDRFDRLLNSDDHSELDDLCAPDMINHSLAPTRPPGLEGTREFLRSDGRDFGNDRWSELHVVAESELVVQFGVRQGAWPGTNFRGFAVPAGSYK